MDRMLQDELLENLLFIERDRPKPFNSGDARRSNSCDYWPRAVLLERVAYLRELARFGDGTASETIRGTERYSTNLAVRLRSGTAERHESLGEILIVLDGHATLVTGDAIEKREPIQSGETRISAITSGSNQELRPGDIVHIPAGMRHQMLLTGNETVSYLAVRIAKGEEA